MRRNPRVPRKGIAQRKHHATEYYTASATIQVSREVKQGLAEIAENEGRSLSWVVSEVFSYYFGLKDDTVLVLENRTKLRRVK